MRNGKSATETEFDTAIKMNKHAFAFIRSNALGNQEGKEKQFLTKLQKKLTYKLYNELYGLLQEINRAFLGLLQEKGYLHNMSFDATSHSTAGINCIEKSLINDFVEIANEQRGFPLKKGTPVRKILIHLDLFLDSGKLFNPALLAFNEHPQKYFPTAIVKCAHFHGKRVEKPIPAQTVINGDIFTQIDKAVDFVLSKIHVEIGPRDQSNQAGFKYEIPREVVSEAIVNAIGHRDYNSNGSVEVRLFKDRLEIQNPGRLPKELSIEKLEKDHGSYPYNPRLAEILYQAAYIERFGTGTSDIFRRVNEAGLEKPDFDLSEGVKIILWRPTTHDTTHDKKTKYVSIKDLTHRLVLVLNGEKSRNELMHSLDLGNRKHFAENYLEPSLSQNLIEMTIPDKPTSKNQKYRLTQKGKKLKLHLQKESQ